MSKNIDKAIAAGPDAIEAELARQEAIYAEQLRKRFAAETRPRSRFAIAAHMTKTEFKLDRLTAALRRERRSA